MTSITPPNTPPDKGLHQHEKKENKVATNPDLKATIENLGAAYKDKVSSYSERTVALHEYPNLADPAMLFNASLT